MDVARRYIFFGASFKIGNVVFYYYSKSGFGRCDVFSKVQNTSFSTYVFFIIDALKIKSNYIKFNDGTYMINPSEKCLQGLTHKNGRAELVLDNVLLINPSIGALYTNMPNVRYNDIKIDLSICDCDLVQKLSNYQKSKLINSISCKVSLNHVMK